MERPPVFEEVAFHLRLAYKTWLQEAAARGAPLSERVTALVWQLLVAYAEALDDLSAARDDIYKTAYDLAEQLLNELPPKRMFAIYRDHLLDAVLESAGDRVNEQFRTLLTFANLISTAFAEAQADQLKKASLHNRAESLSRELKLAKRIQTHLLPKVIPSIPGYEFSGKLIAAEEVGGDYWSVKYKAEDDLVTLKLADITGHGVAAATLVAAVKFISGGYYQGAQSAAEVMRKTNRVLALETPHDIVVTMAYAWLCPSTRQIRFVNAGHSPLFYCRDAECVEVPVTGPVLGVTETAEYEEITLQLAENDVIFFGSDGITEAGMRRPFGIERLKNVVSEASALPAEGIADAVVRAVTSHAPQPHDDISLLVVKVTGELAEH